MTEPRFEELINLYLDNEIGRHELEELKHAIRDNVLRRQKFERACQLHQAARKALASRPADSATANATEERGRHASLGPSQPSRGASAGSIRSSPSLASSKQKQERAVRNASVSVLAERQLRHGAAASVDLKKVAVASASPTGTAVPANTFTFFASPVGMAVAAAFALIGALGLFLLFKASEPDETSLGTGQPNDNSVVSQPIGSVEQKELLRELQGNGGAKPNPTEAMHATIYQSAAGQPATSSVEVGYITTDPNFISSGMPVPSTALPDTTTATSNATVTLQVFQSSQTSTADGSAGAINTSQLQVTLPALSGISGNQGMWVRMSIPPVFAPPADSGNQDNSGTDTPPKVDLP